MPGLRPLMECGLQTMLGTKLMTEVSIHQESSTELIRQPQDYVHEACTKMNTEEFYDDHRECAYWETAEGHIFHGRT
jgi:hypothetical protein